MLYLGALSKPFICKLVARNSHLINCFASNIVQDSALLDIASLHKRFNLWVTSLIFLDVTEQDKLK